MSKTTGFNICELSKKIKMVKVLSVVDHMPLQIIQKHLNKIKSFFCPRHISQPVPTGAKRRTGGAQNELTRAGIFETSGSDRCFYEGMY